MGLADLRSLVVCNLFVLFVMSVVRIDLVSVSQIRKFILYRLTRFANFPISCLPRSQHCSNLLHYPPYFL